MTTEKNEEIKLNTTDQEIKNDSKKPEEDEDKFKIEEVKNKEEKEEENKIEEEKKENKIEKDNIETDKQKEEEETKTNEKKRKEENELENKEEKQNSKEEEKKKAKEETRKFSGILRGKLKSVARHSIQIANTQPVIARSQTFRNQKKGFFDELIEINKAFETENVNEDVLKRFPTAGRLMGYWDSYSRNTFAAKNLMVQSKTTNGKSSTTSTKQSTKKSNFANEKQVKKSPLSIPNNQNHDSKENIIPSLENADNQSENLNDDLFGNISKESVSDSDKNLKNEPKKTKKNQSKSRSNSNPKQKTRSKSRSNSKSQEKQIPQEIQVDSNQEIKPQKIRKQSVLSYAEQLFLDPFALDSDSIFNSDSDAIDKESDEIELPKSPKIKANSKLKSKQKITKKKEKQVENVNQKDDQKTATPDQILKVQTMEITQREFIQTGYELCEIPEFNLEFPLLSNEKPKENIFFKALLDFGDDTQLEFEIDNLMKHSLLKDFSIENVLKIIEDDKIELKKSSHLELVNLKKCYISKDIISICRKAYQIYYLTLDLVEILFEKKESLQENDQTDEKIRNQKIISKIVQFLTKFQVVKHGYISKKTMIENSFINEEERKGKIHKLIHKMTKIRKKRSEEYQEKFNKLFGDVRTTSGLRVDKLAQVVESEEEQIQSSDIYLFINAFTKHLIFKYDIPDEYYKLIYILSSRLIFPKISSFCSKLIESKYGQKDREFAKKTFLLKKMQLKKIGLSSCLLPRKNQNAPKYEIIKNKPENENIESKQTNSKNNSFPFEHAIQKFITIGFRSVPYDSLMFFNKIFNLIIEEAKFYKSSQKKKRNPNQVVLTPKEISSTLSYVLIQANPVNLQTCVAFIQNFSSPEDLESNAGKNFKLFCDSIEFIEQLKI
ncbi:hypothetical protein M0811_00230 [Anaeramoeba ignava]|uniref:VPS9 domain-containing protein n=1 Tax=Anaeramoeba ignava TaxID=1746090 RepID=A0A9Q0LTC1_ANAIG|nr:hypothetical protein M0811_00230 [Anaeramoeba ignava]